MSRWPKCPKCDGVVEFVRYCGARVCTHCGHHLGLARCYCGWAADGGDGRQQLVDRGETIEPEDCLSVAGSGWLNEWYCNQCGRELNTYIVLVHDGEFVCWPCHQELTNESWVTVNRFSEFSDHLGSYGSYFATTMPRELYNLVLRSIHNQWQYSDTPYLRYLSLDGLLLTEGP